MIPEAQIQEHEPVQDTSKPGRFAGRLASLPKIPAKKATAKTAEVAQPTEETPAPVLSGVNPEEMEQATEVEPVTFYSWIDGGDRSHPSSVTIRIAGGERHQDASGRILPMNYHEVRFNMGIYRTSNPVEIREIRKIAKRDTITEDKELYLAAIEDPKRRAARLARKASEMADTIKGQDATIASQNAEIERLKALLNEK